MGRERGVPRDYEDRRLDHDLLPPIPARERRTPRVTHNPPAILLKSTGESLSFAQVLDRAKEKVSIEDLGIERAKIRNTATRGVLVEV